MNKKVKRILKIIGIILAALAGIILIYVLYVLLSYKRIDDKQAVEISDAPSGEAVLPAVSTDETYKIMSYNIGFGAYDHDFDFFMDGGTMSWAADEEHVKNNVNGAAKVIAGEDADFIMVQEVDVDGTRSYHVDEYELLKETFDDYQSDHAVNYDSAFLFWPLYQPHGSNKSGIALFSKYEITESLRRSLPISEGFSKFVDLDRCYTINRIPVEGGKELILINVHLSAYGVDEEIQKGQKEMLFADMTAEYEKGNYVIVGGDFNHDMIGNSNEVFDNEVAESESWAKPFDFDEIPEGFHAATMTLTKEERESLIPTCRDTGRKYDGTNDTWILDSFVYSDNVEMISYENVDADFMYSDHNPVKMEFQLKKQ